MPITLPGSRILPALSADRHGAVRLRGLRSGGWCRRRGLGGPGLRLRSALALHVDAATEMSAFGDRHARRDDITVHGPVVANVDLVAGRHVPGDLAEHDDRLGKDLRLDLAIGADGQNVIFELDGALDMTFDGQVFAAIQLALDHDRFSDVHDVLLHNETRFWTRTGMPRRDWCG